MKKNNRTTAAKRSVRRASREASEAARQSQGALKDVWKAAVEAFNAAEQETNRQVGVLLKSGRLTAREAQEQIEQLSVRLQKERKKAMRQVEDRLQSVQSRVETERKNVGKTVDEAVRAALAAFNIPSRREVSELTRKVEELSGKIDGFRRSSRPAGRRVKSVKAVKTARRRAA